MDEFTTTGQLKRSLPEKAKAHLKRAKPKHYILIGVLTVLVIGITVTVSQLNKRHDFRQQAQVLQAQVINDFIPNLITNPTSAFSVPSVAKPSYLSPIIDPTFQTQITRIVGDPGTTINFARGGTGTWGSDARHHYNEDQPWNADSSLIAVQNEAGGSPRVVYLNGSTYQPEFGICPAYSSAVYDDRWHPNLPNVRINRNNKIELSWWDVVNCTKLRSWILPFDATMDSESGPSRDGTMYALGNSTSIFVVRMDPLPGKVGPALDVSNCGLSSGCAIGHIAISPSGTYVTVHYDGDHPRVFDVDPTTLALTPHSYPVGTPECSGHDPLKGYIYDLGHWDQNLDDNGDDVMVGQKRSWCTSPSNIGQIVMVRLKDGAVTSLIPTDTASSYHISCRNLNRPGWCYASFWPGAGRAFNDEIIAAKLDGSKTVQRFIHTHTDTTNCYRCESHPSPSRDGLRVIFASSWSANCGSSCGSTNNPQDYVMDARIYESIGTTPTQTLTPVPPTALSPTPTLTLTSTPTRTPTPTTTPTKTPTPTLSASPTPGVTLKTFSERISAGQNDVEESVSHGVLADSSDLELLCDTSRTPCPAATSDKQVIGLRFINVTIPQGATITNTYIEFTAKESKWKEPTYLIIQAENTDNSAAFSSSNKVSTRTLTPHIAWNSLPIWSKTKTLHKTPDLAPIVQQVINRAGWTSGNPLTFVISGTGHRTAYSYNGDSKYAPRLVVTYK